MNHIDLFSGIGGFSLACQWNGIQTEVFCERNAQCKSLLGCKFPGIPIVGDVRNFDGSLYPKRWLLTAGDPCPIRSKARSIWGTKQPDLSGYVLAVVARSWPRWVVRENVPASDDVCFIAGLEALGYGTVIVRANSDSITGQCRQRDFIVGRRETTGRRLRVFLSKLKDGAGPYKTRLGTEPIIPALTTHRTRYDSRDCYIWDGRLRILDAEEREAFAGFPPGWTAGFSEATRARMLGNAVVPKAASKIIKAIKEADPHS